MKTNGKFTITFRVSIRRICACERACVVLQLKIKWNYCSVECALPLCVCFIRICPQLNGDFRYENISSVRYNKTMCVSVSLRPTHCIEFRNLPGKSMPIASLSLWPLYTGDDQRAARAHATQINMHKTLPCVPFISAGRSAMRVRAAGTPASK